MNVQRVEFAGGWRWCAEGWQLFMRRPGTWVLMTVISGGISLALSLVPVLGWLAVSMITPALTGGMLFAARELDAARAIEAGYVFQALREPGRSGPMLVLGAAATLGQVLLLLSTVVLLGGFVGMAMLEHGGGNAAGASGLGLLGLTGVLALLLLSLGLVTALFYAVPLVMFTAMPPLAALRSSVEACVVNALPLLALGVAFLVISVVAAIPLGLGFLVAIPVMVAAMYASYRDVYESAAAGAMATASLPDPRS